MTPREIRLLNQLILHEKAFVRDLRKNIGAMNPAQVAFSLRNKGWIIHTGSIAVFDRDGHLCRSGFYYMEESEKEKARKYLEEFNRAAATAPLKEDISEQVISKTSNDQHNKREEI